MSDTVRLTKPLARLIAAAESFGDQRAASDRGAMGILSYAEVRYALEDAARAYATSTRRRRAK